MLRQVKIHDVSATHGSGVRVEFVHGTTVQRVLDDSRLKPVHLNLMQTWLQRHDESFERLLRTYGHEELGLTATSAP